MNKNNLYKKIIINAVAIIAVLVAIILMVNFQILNRQYRSLLVPICMYIILAVSLNLTTGFLGELTLGHAGFMSVGAYSSAIFTINMNLPFFVEIPIALIIGGSVAAFFGILIGVPVLRLKGDYLAIVTLAFGEIIKNIINVLGFTNGAMGLTDIPKYMDYKNITLVYILMVLTILVIVSLVKSRHGRAICAVRDNYIAAEAVGIHISRFKVLAFAVSAFFAGVAGVIWAHSFSVIKPNNFDYNKSIEILVIVVLGGMGNIKGSVIAAIILTVLPEMLRGASQYRMLIYAIVLIAMMLFNSSGIRTRLVESGKLPKFPKFKKKEV